MTVRNIPDATHRALKARAKRHGHSTEAEIRQILQAAVQPAVGLGSLLAGIGRELGGIELPLPRDSRPVKLPRLK